VPGRRGADLATLRLRLEQALRGLPKVPNGKVYLGDRVLRLLDISQVEARERGAGAVSPLHLLVGSRSRPARPRPRCCASAGLTLPRLEAGGRRAAGVAPPVRPAPRHRRAPTPTAQRKPATSSAAGPTVAAPPVGAPRQLAGQYARDLTAQAAAGKMDPVIGRDAETRGCCRSWGGGGKNNPILIGDPGVGKTAVVEGLAIRIAHGDVPSRPG
jgi:ATP-dependent Clp protease ATP-binding subunit ClpB